MAKRRAKTRMETKEFLAIVTEAGEHILLDEAIVRKYRLRAGIVSPFSSQPIVSVTRRVPVVVSPVKKRTKKRVGGKHKAASRKKSAAGRASKKSGGKSKRTLSKKAARRVVKKSGKKGAKTRAKGTRMRKRR
jgi:hypothetical protein